MLRFLATFCIIAFFSFSTVQAGRESGESKNKNLLELSSDRFKQFVATVRQAGLEDLLSDSNKNYST